MPLLDLPAIANDLIDAPAHSTTRSETAQLADLIEHIDAAMMRGVSRRELHARLQKRGLTMSLPVFDNALHRIRKRLGRRAPNRTQSPAIPAQTAPRQTTPPPQAARRMHAETPGTDKNPAPLTSASAQDTSTNRRIKSLDELATENPGLSRMQLIKLEAQQYDQPVLSSASLDELARKYGGPPKA